MKQLTWSRLLGLVSLLVPSTCAFAQQATTNTGYGMYCNQTTSGVVSSVSQSTVKNAINLASTPNTGFSLVNGSGILNPSSGEFSAFSCLDNLFDQGLNILFSPPNLSAILNELINAACTKAESVIQTALQPLDQSFYQSATIDGFSPGFGISTQLNNSGTIGTSVNGINTGLSPNSLVSQIAGQSAGGAISAPTFANAF